MTPSSTTHDYQGHFRADERFYLTLEKPLLVYQRAGGLVVVPFAIDGAAHVVAVRIDPLTDAETVEIIPARSHDPRATLAALVEALDALEAMRDRAQTQRHSEAVRLSTRALVAVRREGQALAETRVQPVPHAPAFLGRRSQRHEARMRAWA